MSANILEMSDEDFLKASPESLVQAVEPEAQEEQEPQEEQQGAEQAESEEASDEGAQASADEGEAPAEAEEKEESNEEETTTADTKSPDGGVEGKAVDASQAETKAEEKTEETQEKSEVKTDIEAEYNKLLAPFVANGREMQVKNVDEAITLMQMGANYNKKMAALKPSLKLLKLLETNGLADEEKISYLIDLANKDAGAINKLVKDSGIDPMDLSTEKADEYKPVRRSVNEKELELDAVLEEIQETPAYQRTLKVVGKEWDVQSRQIVADAPQLLKVINSHVQTGIYDMIIAEVERERMFGRLQGMTDIEAYRQVGDAIQARGGFDHLVAGASNQGQQANKAVVVPPKPRQGDDSRLNDKRRAAAPTKPVVKSSASPKDFNPLAMSDEEFAKLVKTELM
jgi:hypothetical protein